MPWSNQNGGGWKSGGGGGGGPWGQGGGGGSGQPPDLDEIIKRSQDRMKQVMHGSGLPTPLLFLIGMIAVAMLAWYGFFFRVEKDEQGVVMRFGQYVRWEPAGLHFRLPYPIEEIEKPKVTERKKTEIGSLTSASGSSSQSIPAESLMLTGDENIVDINFVVFWRIEKAADYLFNIKKPDQTVKDVAESAMREIVGRSKVGDVLAPGREPIELGVQALMQKILDSYGAGVRIMEVKIQQAQAPAPVRAAFDDVVAAAQDRDRAQNEAQREANRIVPEARGEAERILQAAEGYKQQTVAEATGQTARFLKVFEEYKKAPDVTRKRMFLETMERVLAGTDKIILDPKTGGAGGTGVVPYLPLDQLQPRKQGAN